MSYSVKIPVLNMEIQFSAADQKDLWRQVSLFQSLPVACPIDDTPARFNYRYVDENDFFEVVSTGPVLYKYLLGQYKKGGDLFPKNCWVLWDGDKKEEITLWENGRLTPTGERHRAEALRRTTKPAPVAAIGQPAPETTQNAVAPRQAPTATFAPPAPATQQIAPVQPATASAPVAGEGEPAEPNPFTDPTTGANAHEREPLILAVHKLGKSIYGRNVNEELLKIAAGITERDITGLMQLDYTDLKRLDAIVKLDQTGFRRHSGSKEWYKELKALLPAGKTIYQLSTIEIDRIHANLPMPA